jgi:tetratricopeptide (TPR) repeat protein
MSIIYDALKKAEREREPWIARWPLNRGVRTAHRKWRWGVIIGMVAGVSTALAVSSWLWLQSLLGGPTHRAGIAIPHSSRANVAAIEPRAGRLATSPQPLALAKPLETSPRLKSDEAASPLAAVALAPAALAIADAAFEQARDAESKGQWEQATHHYRQALARNPTLAEAHNNLGNLYVRQQQMTAAISEFRAAIALNPNYAMVHNNLGSAYFLIGEELLAIQEFIAALRLDGAYVSPYYNLASLYARRGDVGQAVAFLTKALALESAVLSWMQEDADFDRIRGAPEFQRLRAQAQVRR